MAKTYKDILELQWPLWGTFQLNKIVYLRKAVESKGSQIKNNNKQAEWESYFNWHAEASIRLQNAKIATLKDSPHKTNEILNKRYLKQRTIRLVVSAFWVVQRNTGR